MPTRILLAYRIASAKHASICILPALQATAHRTRPREPQTRINAAYMERLIRTFKGGGAAVLAAAVAFGVYGILSKFALNAGLEPLMLLFWRFALAALL